MSASTDQQSGKQGHAGASNDPGSATKCRSGACTQGRVVQEHDEQAHRTQQAACRKGDGRRSLLAHKQGKRVEDKGPRRGKRGQNHAWTWSAG